MANILVICMLISNWLRDPKIKCYHIRYIYINIYIYIYIYIMDFQKWKWRDIRPSMVTHTRNLCSAINPSNVHTLGEHTPGFMLRRLGSWGLGALLKGTSVICIEGRESAGHSLPIQSMLFTIFFMMQCNHHQSSTSELPHYVCIEFCMWISVLFVIYYYSFTKNNCVNISLQSLNTYTETFIKFHFGAKSRLVSCTQV